MRVQIPLLICFVTGIVMLVQYFVPHDMSQELFRRAIEWMLVIGVFAFVLGIGSLVHLHAQRIRRRQTDWAYSIVVFVGLIGMALVGLIEGNLQPARTIVTTQEQTYESGSYTMQGDQVTLTDPGLAGRSLLKGDRIRLTTPTGSTTVTVTKHTTTEGEDGTIIVSVRTRGSVLPAEGSGFDIVRPGADLFHWIFRYVQVPLDATMFSLLAFFIASAAFRAFRARNLEATFLLVAASIVILGLTPPFIHAWNIVFSFAPGFPTSVKDWILEVPNMASRRAIFLGIGLGGVAQSFRIILGIERTYLGGGG